MKSFAFAKAIAFLKNPGDATAPVGLFRIVQV